MRAFLTRPVRAFLAAIIAAVITPSTDVISMILWFIPLWGALELLCWLLWRPR
jgi:Sec-independent protein secretion pathway component TatC